VFGCHKIPFREGNLPFENRRGASNGLPIPAQSGQERHVRLDTKDASSPREAEYGRNHRGDCFSTSVKTRRVNGKR